MVCWYCWRIHWGVTSYRARRAIVCQILHVRSAWLGFAKDPTGRETGATTTIIVIVKVTAPIAVRKVFPPVRRDTFGCKGSVQGGLPLARAAYCQLFACCTFAVAGCSGCLVALLASKPDFADARRCDGYDHIDVARVAIELPRAAWRRCYKRGFQISVENARPPSPVNTLLAEELGLALSKVHMPAKFPVPVQSASW